MWLGGISQISWILTKVSYWSLPDTEFTETGTGASWAEQDPTSDVFYVGANGATNDNNLSFYAWAEVPGFSRFESTSETMTPTDLTFGVGSNPHM